MKNTLNVIQKLTRSKVSRYFIPWFAGYYQVDLSALGAPVASFLHLEAFFTRRLKAGARPFDPSTDGLVSPVDGFLSIVSDVSADSKFVVKGKTYRLLDLLKRRDLVEHYIGGQVLVFYLSPSDYHRIHMPLHARETEHYRLGRWSWPVNDWGLRYTKALTGNYRLVSQFQSGNLPFCLVCVGALNVNSIVRRHEQNTVYQKMAEYGHFSFGSTVVLILPKGRFRLENSTARPVRAGESLGTIQ